MSEPKPGENVIAYKREVGRVTVHGYRRSLWDRASEGFQPLTDCKRRPEFSFRSWLWLEFRTLNPERVVLCKRCWEDE